MDGEQAAKLIDEVGIHRLCHFDGCLCGSWRLDGWSPIRLRYCSYEQDKKNLCVYCGRQREESSGYLCPECLVEKDPFGCNITQNHDFRRAEFSIPVQNNED
jgi:hypothetical protein